MAILLRHRGIVRPSCHWLVIHTFFLSFQPRLSYIWRHTCLYRRQFPCYCKTKLAHWHHSLCSHFEEYCFSAWWPRRQYSDTGYFTYVTKHSHFVCHTPVTYQLRADAGWLADVATYGGVYQSISIQGFHPSSFWSSTGLVWHKKIQYSRCVVRMTSTRRLRIVPTYV